jgi:hypothetical protein
MGMEEKDFRRRLLDQELPVDAGAFGRVMERRKSGGAGTAWLGKGIWAAALLIGVAGIGLYVQRGDHALPTTASTAVSPEKTKPVAAARPGTATENNVADFGARQPAAEKSVQANYSGTAPAESRISAAGSASNKKNSRTHASQSRQAAGSQLAGPGMAESNAAEATGPSGNPAIASEAAMSAADWSLLMKQPLRLHPFHAKPRNAAVLNMERSKDIAGKFLQTEWLVEPGYVFKQTPAGASLRRQERFAGAAAFTARVVLPSDKGFQWISGLRYQEWADHFSFSQEHTATHQRIDAYDVIIRVPGQPDRTETRYDTSQIQVTLQESYSDINRYRMIGIPLAFRWSPDPSSIWYVQAGITPAYLLYRGGSRRLSDGTVVSLSEGANINRFQLHAGLAAGMRQFIAPRVALLLEPGLGYNLTHFAAGPMRQRNLQLSLSAGLMFHLGR